MKKGFTLIELLAVIVILAIIALIAVPLILNIISDSKEESRKRSVENIIHTAEIHYAKEILKDPTISNRINIKDIKDEIKGEVPESGYIIINDKGDSIYKVEYKDKVYVKLSTGETIEESKSASKYYIKLATTINGETEPFLGGSIRKEEIEKIITVPTNKVPSDVLGSFDVTDTTTQSETGKVMVWYYDKDSNGLYEVYIGQEGRVKANPDSTKLFNYLINVKEIDLTYFDTSNVTSMWCLFQYCYKLERVIGLENIDTSNVENMRLMFSKCYKLQSLNLSSFDTSKSINMSGMFQFCKSLTELDVSKFNTSNVENMRLMFSNCHKIQSLNLSSFITNKVTDMTAMFQLCISLKEIDVSKFDTSRVTNMGMMFAGANIDGVTQHMQLQKIKGLENFDTSSVTDMHGMFQLCSSLTTLDLSKFDTSNVADMTEMFSYTTNLKPIYIGSKWKTASTTENMFYNSKTTNVDEMCGPGSTHSYCTLN